MRDGVQLFTAVYEPKDTSERYPFLMLRTPYSVAPYGEDKYPDSLGPSGLFSDDGYIFVYQDVRGRYMSEGEFVNVTPHRDHKSGPKDIDESSDTYDTIAWLLENVPNHNGRAGQWGVSYPGFFTAAGMIDAHPALRAVSPQAPIADWWRGDDFHHNGAFFLQDTFNFFAWFGPPRPEPTQQSPPGFHHATPDGYQFFLDLGPLKNANERHFKNEIAFWNDAVAHPNYDLFWRSRNLLPHLRKVAPAVMTVGGWYDAEDLYGPLQIYQAVERHNPRVFNILVMGPWDHGGWSFGDGDRLGDIEFGEKTGQFYREQIEFPFFQHFLKDEGEPNLPEAYMFETGVNRWRRFDDWPSRDAENKDLFFIAGGGLSFERPGASRSDGSRLEASRSDGSRWGESQRAPARSAARSASAAGENEGKPAEFDEYISDPARPVPYTAFIATEYPRSYPVEDQRFAARRPDVAVYKTDVLGEPLTLAGPITADLWVSTSGTDSDWIVKVIDVFPGDHGDPSHMRTGDRLGGYQRLVRAEVLRGRFRNDPSRPEAFKPNEPTHVVFQLNDVLHTFLPGHRVMVQVQSTWFPLVDRNPQTFVPNIFLADEQDFMKATQRVYCSREHPSRVRVGVIPYLEEEEDLAGPGVKR
ncbi:MAG: CocE/NonD family hydrolase [Planctomycetota bacterium]